MSVVSAISISEKKGTRKLNVPQAELVVSHGIKGDAHAGDWHRQVSLLAQESIDSMIEKGLQVKSGDFAENITTTGINLTILKVGDRLSIGETELTISQMGKICHHRCAIFYQAGDCVMPREGIFGVVDKGGPVTVGDAVKALPKSGLSIGIITLSDKGSVGEREDVTGPTLEAYLREQLPVGFVRRELIADDVDKLELMLKDFADTQKFDLIITNGSTGIAPRDIAPDATLKVIDKRLPGFEEAMRMASFKITNRAIISRAVCGIRGGSIIINLPGSPKGAVENIAVIAGALHHAVEKLHGDPADCAR